MMIKKKSAAALCLALLLSLTACGGKSGDVELTVFAAASLTETLTELAARYQSATPGVSISFNFDSSGTLQTQIQEGAVCDLFLSAAPKQMDALEADGLLEDGTRLDLLENKVALAVPEGNPGGVESFDDLAERLKAGDVFLAVGGGDVPVGQYTRKIFDYYGIEEAAVSDCLTYGSNVKEVTSQVAEAAVDCGVIYATDACSVGLTVVDEAAPELCGQVIYPAAVLKDSRYGDGAKAFLDYLRTPEAAVVFEAVGFTPLE